MRSRLESRKFKCKALNEQVTLMQLNWAQMQALNSAIKEDPNNAALLMCQLGVKEWQTESLDDLSTCLPADAIFEVNEALQDFLGMNPGNSEGTLRAVSHSD